MSEKTVVTDPTVTVRFPCTAGRLIAGQVERRMLKAACEYDVDLSVEKTKGWLEVLLLFRVTGPRSKVTAFVAAADAWAEEIGHG